MKQSELFEYLSSRKAQYKTQRQELQNKIAEINIKRKTR